MGGWLTPPTIAAETICRVLFIPNDRDTVMAVNGAIYALTLRTNWTQFGAVTPDEIAVRMFDMYSEYLQSECGVSCEQIIDCIENDEDVQAAFNQWLIEQINNNPLVQQALSQQFDPSKGGVPIPQYYADKNQYGAALGCDNDDGWGHIRDGLIERSFQRVRDTLERIEFVTDNQEMIAEFLDGVPGVGAFFDVIPVTQWILFFDQVRAWMKEAFESGDTVELRDQIACDLFCIWQIECSLSLEQIRAYYWEKTAFLAPSWDNAFTSMTELAAKLAYSTELDLGTAIIYALVGTQYGFLTYINEWFGIHINATGNDLAVGEPSDDWMALCEECPPVTGEEVTDFATGENVEAWTIEFGDLQPGIGVESVYYAVGGGYRVVRLTRTVPTGSILTGYLIEGTYTAGTLVPSGDATSYVGWGSYVQQTITTTQPTMPLTGTALDEAGGAVIISLTPGINGGGVPSDPGGVAIIERITLYWSGVAP